MASVPVAALAATAALLVGLANGQSTGPGIQGAVRGGGVTVPGATVVARRGTAVKRTTTNAAGFYLLPSLTSGNWVVTVTMPGFAAATQAAQLPASGRIRINFALTLAPYVAQNPNRNVPPPQLGRGGQAQAEPPPVPAGGASAAAALAINGSQDNAAASPYATSPAFGNHRPGPPSLLNGGLGLIFDSSALDARPYSLTGQQAPRPSYTNLTGTFEIGGPLLIPRLFNPVTAPFVELTYRKQILRSVATAVGLVPTPAERSGDLSGFPQPILDPATRKAFPGNMVPVSAPASVLLALYPLPNLPGGQALNYETALVSAQHVDELQLRLDEAISRTDGLSGSLHLLSSRRDTPSLFGFTDRGGDLDLQSDLHWRHTFTPRLFATLGFGYQRERTQLTPFFADRKNVSAAAGIVGNDQSPANWGPPTLSFANGLAGLTDGDALRNRNQSGDLSFAGSWNPYGNNFKFGFDLRRLEFNYWQQQDGRGRFIFNGAATGNALADFLLGIPEAETLAFGNADKYLRQSTSAAYFTDTWRPTDSLSLDLGVRWEYAAPVTERYGRLVNLDVAPDFSAAAPVIATAPVGPLTGMRYPGALMHGDARGIEPRLGLAWTPFAAGSLVVRSGYGVYYDTSVYPAIALQMAQQAPLSTSLNLINSPSTPLTLTTGFLAARGALADTFGVDPNFRPGYIQTWDASIQQDLPDGMVGILGYAGNKGTHSQQEFLPNTFAPGAANPCPSCPSGFLYLASNGNSTYESGQAALQRRYHEGLAWALTYTYAHAIDDSGLVGIGLNPGEGAAAIAQNWRDLSGERGNSDFDQRQKLTLATVYSTGVGLVGGAVLRGWEGALWRGWTLQTQFTLASGLPLTPATALLVPGTVYQTVRPSLTGHPLVPSVPGLHLNPTAYALPPPGSWGDASRNSITGPGILALDAGLQRSFPLSTRFTAQLRIDATNVLNHVTYPSWDVLLGSAQFGLPLAANPMRSLKATLRVTF